MIKKLLPIIFLSTTLWATEYAPWFSPLWQFEGRVGYTYSHTERVQSPSGSFTFTNNYHDLFTSLAATIWPEINLEAELAFVKSDTLPFSYETLTCTGRRLLWDEAAGDWISAVVGATLALPSGRILRDYNYAYHGYINAELHVALGKEFSSPCALDWSWRIWGLFGMGVAEKGSPWTHGIVTFDQALAHNISLTLFLETLFGGGGGNINPLQQPFGGYASIRHQTVDLGGALHYDMGIYATLTVLGYINLYAHNFTAHTFGCNITLLIPFGI